jgi:hypothetical protein
MNEGFLTYLALHLLVQYGSSWAWESEIAFIVVIAVNNVLFTVISVSKFWILIFSFL